MINLYYNKKDYFIDDDQGELIGKYHIHKDSVVFLIRGDYDNPLPTLKGKNRLVIDECTYIIDIKKLLKILNEYT